jgi:hypothetical protein
MENIFSNIPPQIQGGTI